MVTIITLGIGTVIGMLFMKTQLYLKSRALKLAKKEVIELAAANANLLMEKHGVAIDQALQLAKLPEINNGIVCQASKEQIDAAFKTDTDGDCVEVTDEVEADFIYDEDARPRFRLNPDKKEDKVWDKEGNHHVRYYIKDAHDWDKGS